MATKTNKKPNVPNLRFPGFEEAWQDSRLGEIAKFSKGKGISKSDIDKNGTTECIRYGELYTYYGETIDNVKSKTNVDVGTLILSEANDVIIPASGETMIDIATASCVLKSGVALGGDLNIIKTKNDGVFLSYYLNSKKKLEIANLAQGISVVHLYSSQLSSLSLRLPSLEEQKRISKFLAALDKRIQTQNKIIEDLELLKRTISNRIFEQKLRFKNDGPDGYPDWKIKNLGEICEVIGGGTPETSKSEYWNGDIQWFTPTEIKTNYVEKSARTITVLGLKSSSAKLLPRGTILLTTRATVGEVAIALTECTTNQGFQSLVVKEGVSNIFIFNWLKEHKHELVKRANGSTFAEVSKSEIEKIPISIPSLSEQTKIACCISSVDAKIAVERVLLKKWEEQKRILLTNLFI